MRIINNVGFLLITVAAMGGMSGCCTATVQRREGGQLVQIDNIDMGFVEDRVLKAMRLDEFRDGRYEGYPQWGNPAENRQIIQAVADIYWLTVPDNEAAPSSMNIYARRFILESSLWSTSCLVFAREEMKRIALHSPDRKHAKSFAVERALSGTLNSDDERFWLIMSRQHNSEHIDWKYARLSHYAMTHGTVTWELLKDILRESIPEREEEIDDSLYDDIIDALYSKMSEHYIAMAEYRESRQKTGYHELVIQSDENGIALPLHRDGRRDSMVRRVMQLFMEKEWTSAE